MTSFGVLRAPRAIHFGGGQRRALPALTRQLGTRAFLCTDARMAAEPAFRDMVDGLRRLGVTTEVYDGTLAELPLSCVTDCAGRARVFGPDVMVAVGGGSCLDLAKVAGVLLAHGGRPQDFYGEFKVPDAIVPIVAVPTTSGTGSEVTPVAVLGDPERALKVGIASPFLIPTVALCDPELTHSCPPGLTAASGADALTHAIEAFTAKRRPATPGLALEHVFVGKNMISDRNAFEAVRLIMGSLRRAVEDPGDATARSDMMLGSLLAGLAFGTAGTAAAHAIQYPVGTLTSTAHGLGVAALLPYVMRFNRTHCEAELADLATAFEPRHAGTAPADRAGALIDAVTDLFQTIGIPASLAALGVTEDRLDWIAEHALGVERLLKNNPRPIDGVAMRGLVQAAFDGRSASNPPA